MGGNNPVLDFAGFAGAGAGGCTVFAIASSASGAITRYPFEFGCNPSSDRVREIVT